MDRFTAATCILSGIATACGAKRVSMRRELGEQNDPIGSRGAQVSRKLLLLSGGLEGAREAPRDILLFDRARASRDRERVRKGEEGAGHSRTRDTLRSSSNSLRRLASAKCCTQLSSMKRRVVLLPIWPICARTGLWFIRTTTSALSISLAYLLNPSHQPPPVSAHLRT